MNRVLNKLNLYQRECIKIVSNFYMYFLLKFHGIKFGKNLSFHGITHLSKSNSGKIEIGSNCTFRSYSNSNLIGINRPCMMSVIGNSDPKIIIGDRCGFSGTVIGAFSEIYIGNDVRCGANTLITDSDWHLDDPRSSNPSKIVIENNVWLGVNVVVLKGVRIGLNSVIGANSVVTKDIPANVVAAGNPCKVIKELSI